MAPEPEPTDFPRCYRDPENRGGVICQRCDRPICPQCMTQATVGFHCPECLPSRSHPGEGAGAQRRIRTVIPGRWVDTRPRATQAFIGLSLIGFVYSLLNGGTPMSLGNRAAVDGALFARAASYSGGGFDFIGVDAGEYYRLVTAAFLHDGLIHLGFNLYALWILGTLLEHMLSRPRFVALYVVSMLGGSFGVMLMSPNQSTVGASGAVFGLMGALVFAQRSVGVSVWRTPLMPILALNLALTFIVPSISVGGHLGGLATGVGAGWLFVALARRRVSDWVAVVLCGAVSAALVLGAIWAAAQWSDPLF